MKKARTSSLFFFMLFSLSSCGSTSELPHYHQSIMKYTDTYHYEQCETCGEVLSENSPHTFIEQVIKEATCSIKGSKTLSCECGYHKDVEIPLLAHDYNQDTYLFDETGHFFSCKNCDATTEKEAHTWDEGIITSEPSIGVSGIKRFTCTICHYNKDVILDPLPEEEQEATLVITSYDLDEHPYLDMVQISQNPTYPHEFTFASQNSYIESSQVPHISSIEIHLYGYSNKLAVYGDSLEKVLYTEKKTEKVNGAQGFRYIYPMKQDSSFKIENTSTSDMHAYSITIHYKGKLEKPNFETINLEQAQTLGKALDENNGMSALPYILSGKVTQIEGKYITLTDANTSLLLYSEGKIENMYLDYQVTVKGKLQNQNGTIVLIRYSLISYEEAYYHLTFAPLEHGTIEASKTEQIAYGEKVVLTIHPESNYKLEKLYVNGKEKKFVDNTSNVYITQNSLIEGTFTYDYGEGAMAQTYDFSTYEAGEDKAENEEHILDENTTLISHKGFFSSSMILYPSSSIEIASQGTLRHLSFIAGNEQGNLAIYGSLNGENYSIIQTISLDSADDKTYEVLLMNQAYNYLKIESLDKEVHIASFTLTYIHINPIDHFSIYSIEMMGTYGDSNLIQYGNYDILIDGGTDSDSEHVKEAIDTYVTDGVLDLLIITHPDSDHYAGITEGNPFENLQKISMMVTNDHKSNEPIIEHVANQFPDMESFSVLELVSEEKPVHTLQIDENFGIDFLFHPGYLGTNKNNGSVATMFHYKNTLLFMGGDMEKSSCANFMPVHPDLTEEGNFVIFKALHHASNGSNTDEFLAYLKPDFAFVTAGMKRSEPNYTPSYNAHPYLDASVRIGKQTTSYYWSGITGLLTITCNGYNAVVSGSGRSRDYYVYDPNTKDYILSDKEKEKNSTYFASYFYLNAVVNMDYPNLANAVLFTD